MGADDGETRGFWVHPQDENGWWADGRIEVCCEVNSLFLLSLLEDEGDELLEQQDEDEEPNDPAHNSQDDEGHCVVHFFHCVARAGREGGGQGGQESSTWSQAPWQCSLQPQPLGYVHPSPQPSPGLTARTRSWNVAPSRLRHYTKGPLSPSTFPSPHVPSHRCTHKF